MAKTCAQCGVENPADARFCCACAAPMKAPIAFYDGFISYRREGGGDLARLIRLMVETGHNKNLFLDVDELRTGRFDEKLLAVIANAGNFILILSVGALDRCKQENDWLRREIVVALASKRNIIPVLVDGFRFPPEEELPEELRILPRYNAVKYDHHYLDAAIGKIVQNMTHPSEEETGRPAPPPVRSPTTYPLEALPEEQTKETSGSPKDTNTAVWVGKRVGSFVLRELIGRGGSGLVFRALQPEMGINVCVKLLFPLPTKKELLVGALRRGIRGLSAINHPNIIHLRDFGSVAGFSDTLYMAMDLIEGWPLLRWTNSLRDNPAAWASRLRVAWQLATAMDAAHNARYTDEVGFDSVGVMHGDLKPANIIIRNDGSPVILDFMIADAQQMLSAEKAFEPSLDGCTRSFGTPGFMPKEQEERGLVNVRTDVFSLGITLCHLFFPTWETPRPSASSQNEPESSLGKLLCAMISDSSDRRPASMRAVASALEKLAQETGVPLTGTTAAELRFDRTAPDQARGRSAESPIMGKPISSNSAWLELPEGELHLFTKECRIGRSTKGNNLVVSERLVSGQHAVIAVDREWYALVDQHSTHGTYLNGQLVRKALRLKDGDEISFGKVFLMRFRCLCAG